MCDFELLRDKARASGHPGDPVDNTFCLKIMLFHHGCGATETQTGNGSFFVILLPFLAAQDELLLRNTLFYVSKGIAGGNMVTFI